MVPSTTVVTISTPTSATSPGVVVPRVAATLALIAILGWVTRVTHIESRHQYDRLHHSIGHHLHVHRVAELVHRHHRWHTHHLRVIRVVLLWYHLHGNLRKAAWHLW